MSGSVPSLVRWLVRAGVIPKAAVTQLDDLTAPEPQSVLDAGRLAEQTYSLLDELNDEVVLVARMGQNLRQFDLTYSHLGFCYRGANSEWQVLHLLNKEDARSSGLFEEGITNFYSDNLYRFESCVLRLPVKVQLELRAFMGARAKHLHCKHYSLTSHPYSLSTQNSNQWVLEVLAAALSGDPTPSRLQCQEWLKAQGYQPSVLHIPLWTQWAGPLLRDSISFADQPATNRRTARIETVTVDSVVQWLQGSHSPLGPGTEACQLLKLALN